MNAREVIGSDALIAQPQRVADANIAHHFRMHLGDDLFVRLCRCICHFVQQNGPPEIACCGFDGNA